MLKKGQLLGGPAGSINYVLVAKSFMNYSEIAFSALHLVKSDTTIK